VVEAVKGSDFCLLVTEPTPFGLNDLRLAVGMIRKLRIPIGVVINRADVGDRKVWHYCEEESIPILMEIPLDRRIAEAYSKGVPLIKAIPEYRDKFLELYNKVSSLSLAK
jgi:MinD superfamily P-loop ATPase